MTQPEQPPTCNLLAIGGDVLNIPEVLNPLSEPLPQQITPDQLGVESMNGLSKEELTKNANNMINLSNTISGGIDSSVLAFTPELYAAGSVISFGSNVVQGAGKDIYHLVAQSKEAPEGSLLLKELSRVGKRLVTTPVRMWSHVSGLGSKVADCYAASVNHFTSPAPLEPIRTIPAPRETYTARLDIK